MMKRLLPLVLSLAALWALAFQQYRTSLAENDGQFVYALDDAYIHMAIARNFAGQGVWGVTPLEFTSSSSSILWTLLLAAAYKALGVSVLLPFILNVVFASLALVLADAMLRGPVPSALYRFLALAFLIVATPFAPLMTGGMEHTLQILIMLGFSWASARALADADGRPLTGAALLMFLSALLVAFVRYECAFLALVVCLLLFLRRRWFQSIALGLLVLLPVAVYGWISRNHGWYVLPNSVLLKSGMLNAESGDVMIGIFGSSVFSQLQDNPHLLFLVFLALALFVLRSDGARGFWEERQMLLLIFVAATFLHMQFADAGWFYRYEAYLMALGLVAVVAAAAEFAPQLERGIREDRTLLPRPLALLFLFMLLVIPAMGRGIHASVESTQAMNDRYFEHLIPSSFVKRYYDRDVIMANDIGALCYLTDARVLDMYGLGNLEPAVMRAEPGGYTREDVRDWAEREGVRIAILQLGWSVIKERIPTEWVKVGVWEVPRNIVFGDTEVGWYAVNEAEAEVLAAHLKEFASEVPEEIAQSGRYRGDTDKKGDGSAEVPPSHRPGDPAETSESEGARPGRQ